MVTADLTPRPTDLLANVDYYFDRAAAFVRAKPDLLAQVKAVNAFTASVFQCVRRTAAFR